MRERFPESPSFHVLYRSFLIAAETGERARPVHLLVAMAELDTPVGTLLGGAGQDLYERTPDPPVVNGGGGGYLLSQTQQAAAQLAGDEPVRPEHLLVAIIDQSEPEAASALSRAGLDAAAVRSAALALVGGPADLPRLAMPALVPAGTHDRPPLAVEELDPRAWRILTWRQGRLPLDRVRRIDDWRALSSLESRAARRLADRLRLDDDQRYSLHAQHHLKVETLAHAAHPGLVDTREMRKTGVGATSPIRHPRRGWERRAPSFMVGWPTWFGNRRSGLRDRRFRLVTRASYRDQPAPTA